ncbi:hypothetical protein JCM3770_005358 [Rhodotorula araucariae]
MSPCPSRSGPPPRLVPREPDLDALEAALETSLADATSETKDELRRLARYRAPPSAHLDFPKNKLAGVLVLLHLNPLGELSVTLTTRSQRLRSHPGETALPGGRWEEGDGEGGAWTALREAHEEINLPLPPRESIFPSPSATLTAAAPPPSHLLHLTTLPPFTSRTLLVVLPVVFVLLAPAASASTTYLPATLRPSPDEVAAVFHLSLRAFLLLPPSSPPCPPKPATRGSRPAPGTETLTHTQEDFLWLLRRPYRLHAFSSPVDGVTPSAVTGLTADIVVECAVIARGTNECGFVRRARGQMRWEETVSVALEMSGRKGLGERVSGEEEVDVVRIEDGQEENGEEERT